MQRIGIVLFCLMLFCICGCQSSEIQELEKKWNAEQWVKTFEAGEKLYTLDMGAAAFEIVKILETENWIYEDSFYEAFQGWNVEMRFYYEQRRSEEDNLRLAVIFKELFEFQGKTYKIALYPFVETEDNKVQISSPSIEVLAMEVDKDASIDYIERDLELDYTYIGKLEGFQFPERFGKPAVSSEEKRATKELELYQEAQKFWPKELHCIEGTAYLQYWDGFSHYYRIVYQDKNNEKYYRAIVDGKGEIQEEQMFIEYEEYKRICELGVKL